MELRAFLEAKDFSRVPLKKLPTGHYQISLKINNNKGFFIVDTGASNSCVGLEFAPQFELINEATDIEASGAGSSNMKTEISNNNTISIFEKSYRNCSIILFDLSHVNNALVKMGASKVHGIIGADLLKKWRSVIDYGRNCIYIK